MAVECANTCVVTSLQNARSNILRQITAISESTLGNNYSISIEGHSVTNGADTNVQNMANLVKQLKDIEDLLVIYCPYEIHTVVGD